MSIADEIEQLRAELPWVYSNPPHILEISDNEKIVIVAADRPDKAVVIGPGGYIAGKLAKIHGKSLSITAYTDHLIKDFRIEESRRAAKRLNLDTAQEKIVKMLEILLNETDITKLDEKREKESKVEPVAVALSGGRDSLATAVLLQKLFHIKGFTVYPSDMILPLHVRESIDESVKTLGIDHEYIPADFSETIQKSLQGRIHPCGHCHRTVSDILIEKCADLQIPALAFGELLPTGSQSLRVAQNVLLINLPAFLALTKRDTTAIASAVCEYSSYTLGCPLLKAVHREFPFMKYATAKRVLREVRAGVLEPGEALKYLKAMM